MTGNDPFPERLFYRLIPKGQGIPVRDVRIGLSYVYVELADNRTGISALSRSGLNPSCSVCDQAGSLTDQSAGNLLRLLLRKNNPLEKAIGLATANALIAPPSPEFGGDALDLMDINPDDHVVMVGFFRPLAEKIERRGIPLSILERDARRGTGILDEREQKRTLAEGTVAIITAMTLVNGTLQEILDRLGTPRHVAILGPSTPACPEIFQNTAVNHLGGSVIQDREKIRTIISHGGGTPQMRPHLRFFNLQWKSGRVSP